jgi:hypothetical protein
MRYWAYLGGKLLVGGACLYGLLVWMSSIWPVEPGSFSPPLLQIVALMGWFLLASCVLYVIVYDQRYRCRTCLRRLRMPVESGSWGHMLQFGRPRIEYICTYGHGTLQEEELQISGLASPQWTPHSDDMWEELYAAAKDADDQP